MQQPSLHIDLKLKTNLENEGVELSPKVGVIWVGRSMAEEGKREGVQGRVCQESVAMLGVCEEVKSFVGIRAKRVTTDDVVEEE